MTKTKSSAKPRLDRDRILDAAVEYADHNGIEKLNMRTLARELGSGVMSLYNYVENKEDLLAGMVDIVAAEIAEPVTGQGWREAITTIAVSAHRTFFRHRWVGPLWVRTGGQAKLAHQETILRVLREGGFSVHLACRGYHAVTMHATGFSIQALAFPNDAESMKAAATTFLAEADPEEIPYFVEHVRHHQQHPETEGEFAFVLDLILDGLERLLLEEQAQEERQ